MHEPLRKRWASAVLAQLSFFIFLNLVVTSCATGPTSPLPSHDEIVQARLRDLLDSVEIEKSKNATLARTVARLENQLKVKQQKEGGKKTSKVEVIRVRPKVKSQGEGDTTEVFDDYDLPFPTKKVLRRPVEDSNDSGESIADSSHEAMHWYFRGLKQNEMQEWESSLRSFEQFLELSPNHVYADRAEYWLVDGYYRAREFQLAVVAANRLEARFHSSFRIPDGRYLSAMAHFELGQKARAQEIFRSILKEFPSAPIAREAGIKLAALFTSTTQKNPPPLLEQTPTVKR